MAEKDDQNAPESVSLGDYLNEVQVATSWLQFVEEALKMYLAESYHVIDLSLGGRLPFRFSYEDVADQPLGPPLRLFKKHNDDSKIHRLLDGVPRERNQIVHRAYLLTQEQIHSPAMLAQQLNRVRALSGKADQALRALLEQVRSVEAIREELEGSRQA